MLADTVATLVLEPTPRIEEPRKLLRSIVADTAIAFTPHPLGFVRCHLGESSRGLVYLHCWPGTPRFCQSDGSNVHRHSVAVASLVLAGELTDATYEWRSYQGGDCRLFAQDLNRPSAGLAPTSEVGHPVLTQSKHVRAGERYLIPSGTFHSTEVDWTMLVVTAAVFVAGEAGVPLVVGSASGARLRRYEAPTLDNSELLSRIRDLV